MTTSFAAYASQYLTRQPPPSSLSSSQPLFFSFSTDNESRHGSPHDHDLDDLDDPHLRISDAGRVSTRRLVNVDEYDDDPYLRLDEEAGLHSHSIPLLGSHHDDSDQESNKGWLAHQAAPSRDYRPSSPSSASSSSNDSGSPPPDIMQQTPLRQPPTQPPPPPPTHISLTESLLPRDGSTKPLDIFSLPDPRHVSRRRRKYNDYIWTATWCAGLSLCLFFSILVLFLTHTPTDHPRVTLPYTALLHTVPLLSILVVLSAAVSYIHILLLRVFVKPVMIATSVFIPATLLVSAIWAFVGSFMWDANVEPTWGETVGLRLFSLVPLVLSLFTARRLLDLPREIHTASSLLTLTTQLLQNNPFLLGLSPVVLFAALLVSIPFLTLTFRLLLIGNFVHPQGNSTSLEWYVRGWANWAIAGTVAIWLWSWGVARGILRVTCAGVVGAWYFADPSSLPPPPTSTHTIHAALTRATSPSLGSVVLSALIITGIRLLGLLTALLRLFPAYLPLPLRPYLQPLVIAAGFAVGYLESATSSLSTYGLIYTGLTGDAFFPSARRANVLTISLNSSVAKYKRFKTEPPLTMLTYSPLTLTFPFALSTYLFVAHTLNAPDQALSAAVLAGGVTAIVGLFCVGLVKDTADTLFICYCIDQDTGKRRRNEVFSAFEYESNRRPHQPPQQQQQQPYSRSQPQPPQAGPSRINPPPAPSTPISTPVRQHRLQSPIAVDPVRRPSTPDPFQQSPLEDDEEEINLEAAHLTSSLGGYRISTDSSATTQSKSEGLGASELTQSRQSNEQDEDESQLFPGSDIF